MSTPPDPSPSQPVPLSPSTAMVNVTLDDSSAYITYSDGWGVAPASDPNLEQFFQYTYHGTETVGSNATVTFLGTAVYLYGSKGPNHGDYAVSIDGQYQSFSGYANDTLYQQCLYYSPLESSYHTVILVNTGSPDDRQWLDLDYIVTTVPENSSFPNQPGLTPISSTVSPPGSGPSPTSSTPPNPSSSNNSASASSAPLRVMTVLAIVFGISTFVLLLIMFAFWCLRRSQRKAEAERVFRYGPPRSPVPRPLHYVLATQTRAAPEVRSVPVHPDYVSRPSPRGSYTPPQPYRGRGQPPDDAGRTFMEV